MVSKSWIVTIIPLIVALIGTGYTLATGATLTPEQLALLQTLFAAFIGSGAVGAYVSVRKAALRK